ncbi:MAG: diaminopimelate decarboxylase, partial [Candidatus Omnitrophica bacterium]|nr:diaminopimelate decarboxylase [Candidatus Omnitrophota bacterium]
EPGRFIAGNSGILVTEVVYVKRTPSKNFAIVNAGMNDLIRPSLYSAYHEILPVERKAQRAKRSIKYDIVGPICESGDFLGKNRPLPSLQANDLLAVLSAGAYGFTMSSNYNSRPRVAEVLVKRASFSLIRKRESYRDLIRHERY